MNKNNSIEASNLYPNLNDQKFRSNKIKEVGDCVFAQIKERELMSKNLNKYIVSFDYFDKSLIVSSAISGTIFTASFATVIGAPVGISSGSFSLAFSISTTIVKNLLKTTRNKIKKAH